MLSSFFTGSLAFGVLVFASVLRLGFFLDGLAPGFFGFFCSVCSFSFSFCASFAFLVTTLDLFFAPLVFVLFGGVLFVKESEVSLSPRVLFLETSIAENMSKICFRGCFVHF